MTTLACSSIGAEEGELRGRTPPLSSTLDARRRTGSESGVEQSVGSAEAVSRTVRHRFQGICKSVIGPAPRARHVEVRRCDTVRAREVRPFDELRRRLAEISDLSACRRAARLGPAGDDAAARRRGPRRAARDAQAHRAREVHLARDRRGCSRSSSPSRRQHEYDSFEASLIRVTRRDWEKARKVPVRASRRDVARRGARASRSGSRRARTTTSPPSCRRCARTSSSASRYIECFDGEFDEPYDVAPRRLRARR